MLIGVKSRTSIAENVTCLGTKRGKNWNFPNRKEVFPNLKQFLFSSMGVTAGKQSALVLAHCILGYYFSSALVPLWKSKCSWKVHCFYLKFSVFYVKESSSFQLTMAPAKSRKIVVMGFRSVGNFWIVLATCRKDLAGSFCSVTMRDFHEILIFFCIFLFRKIFNYNSVCRRTICGFIRSDNWEQWVILLNSFDEKNSEVEPWTQTWFNIEVGPCESCNFCLVFFLSIYHWAETQQSRIHIGGRRYCRPGKHTSTVNISLFKSEWVSF